MIRYSDRNRVFRNWLWPLILTISFLIMVTPSLANSGNSRLSLPNSRLESPFQSPVLVTGHLAMALGGVVEGTQKGIGAAFIFHPSCADRFLDFMNGLNSSIVLQAEFHRIDENQRVLSGDMLVRRYLSDFSVPHPRRAMFVGVGFGASEVSLAPPNGRGMEIGWEYLVETGQEWNMDKGYLLYWQLQYRSYRYNKQDFSHWSMKLGAGLPWPW